LKRSSSPPATRAFGGLLKRLRRDAGLTQAALAVQTNYSAVYIGMLERGERSPSSLTIDLLAEALNPTPGARAALHAAARRARTEVAGPYPDMTALPPLVGRAAEVATLDRHLAGEGPPVAVLAGEPGIGKTRLLHETVAHARGRGWAVLFGSCQRRDPPEPYSPLLEALERHVRSLSPDALRPALQDCAWLARVLPELAVAGMAPAPLATMPPERERRLVVGAIARFVSNVAGPAGTLLVLDDLQWASPEALDALLALAHAVEPVPIRVVCAYRSTDVRPQDALNVALADLAQAGLATHRHISPLSPEDARRMLDGLVADSARLRPGLRDRVVTRAGGVPFFIVSYAHGIDGDQDDVPWNVTQSVRQRIAAVPDLARELLDVAAVIGRDSPHDLLLAMAPGRRDAALDAVEAACRRRLLEEDGAGVRFAHDVIREVVEADLGAARRAGLHRRVAEALEGLARPPAADLLAYHYSRSDTPDRALAYMEQAADQASARAAHATAADHLQALVGRLDALGRAGDAARAREKQGAALSALGRYDAALAALDGAATAYRGADDLDGFGRAIAHIGQVYGRRGTPDEGFARIEQSLPDLARADATRGLATAYAALAHLCWLSGRYDEQAVAAAHAARAARAVGDDRTLAAAEGRRGAALYQQGRFDEALAVLGDAARVAEAAGDAESLWRALTNISTIYFTRGEFERCRPVDEQALRVARGQNDPVSIARILSNRGEGALYRGEWAQARADFNEACALVRGVGDTEATVYPLLDLASLHLLEGRWDELASLDDVERLAGRTGDLQALRWLGAMRAELDIRQGYPGHARARFASLLDRPGLEETDVAYMLPVLAWAHLEEGDLTVAADVAARAVDRARAHDHRVVLVDALRIDALVSCRAGHRREAVACLDQGLALAAAMPYPLAEARLLHAYGEVEGLIVGGSADAARERLEAALTIYERLGARADAALALHDLTALPYRQHLSLNGIVVTHGQWARIDALSSEVSSEVARRGRQRADQRRTTAAILYVWRTGCRWADLPPAFGDDSTAHRRYQQWRADGTWEHIRRIVPDGVTME